MVKAAAQLLWGEQRPQDMALGVLFVLANPGVAHLDMEIVILQSLITDKETCGQAIIKPQASLEHLLMLGPRL
jgi:hypothetical protein